MENDWNRCGCAARSVAGTLQLVDDLGKRCDEDLLNTTAFNHDTSTCIERVCWSKEFWCGIRHDGLEPVGINADNRSDGAATAARTPDGPTSYGVMSSS